MERSVRIERLYETGITWCRKGAVLLALMLAVAASTAWLMERQMPLTSEQEALLRAQVAAVAQQTGQSRQAVWSRVKRAVGVQRIDDIPRHHYDTALAATQ